MKWKLNVLKTISTPIEVEADDLISAVDKAYAIIPEINTDRGQVGYAVDTTASKDLIKWSDKL